MKISLLLLDVAPDPVTPVIGVGGLILLVLVVLMLVSAGVFAFVFFLRWLKRRSPNVSEGSSAQAQLQPSNPNQP